MTRTHVSRRSSTAMGVRAAVVLLLAVAMSCNTTGRPQAAPAALVTATPTASCSTPRPLPDAGVFAPGKYRTNLQPTMTLKVPFPDWEVDVNAAGWVGLEYPLPEPYLLATLNIIRVDKVFDPRHPDRLIDPPQNLSAFISHLPGVTVLSAPRRITFGGVTGRQFDLLIGPHDVQVGPIPGVDDVQNGFAATNPVRIVEVVVDGQHVEIMFGSDADPLHFEQAIRQGEPVVRSIHWHQPDVVQSATNLSKHRR